MISPSTTSLTEEENINNKNNIQEAQSQQHQQVTSLVEDEEEIEEETKMPTTTITKEDSSSSSNPKVEAVSGVAGAASSSSSKSLNWWRLSAIAFVFTSCGPFGIEACVSSGGAALTLATVFITPLVYVIPQVLMVSELSMMMPSNHGHIAWVERGWGRFAGAFNAYNALLTNSIDLSLYPVLGGNYFVAHFLPGASDFTKVLVRAAMVAIGLAIAVRSAKIVSDAAVTVSLMIILPFLFLFIVALPKISPSEQWGYNPNKDGKVDWAAFSASSLWLYTGWNSLGALGGDVEGGGSNRKIFVKGLSFALLWDILMYLFPLVSALVIPGGDWEDGYLSVAFGKLLPGCGLLVSVCGMISTMGLFVSSLACYARTIWGMADLGWLPKFLAKADPETHSPVNATAAQVIAIIPLLFLSFSYLQRLEFCLAAVSYLLTFGSFLRLRYTEPEAHRPYIVPGGLPVAWLITITKVLVFVFILASNFDDSSLMIGVVVVNGAIAVGYYWYCKQNPSFALSALEQHQTNSDNDQNENVSSNNNENGEEKVSKNRTSRGPSIISSPTTILPTTTTKDSDEDILTNPNNNQQHATAENPFHPPSSTDFPNPATMIVSGRAAVAADAIHNVLHHPSGSGLSTSHENSSEMVNVEGLTRRREV